MKWKSHRYDKAKNRAIELWKKQKVKVKNWKKYKY